MADDSRAKVGDFIVAELYVDVEVLEVTEKGYKVRIDTFALETTQDIDESQFYEPITEGE